MIYVKQSNVYKASNVEFNCDRIQAYSYGWWRFVDKVNGKVIFNNFRYSHTTSRHQTKVMNLLNNLGIKIDVVIEASLGLNNLNGSISDQIFLYKKSINSLEVAMSNPRTQLKTLIKLNDKIFYHKDQVTVLNNLLNGKV